MLHLRRRNLGFPDLAMERTPNFGQLLVLEHDEDEDAYCQANDACTESLEENPPGFVERKEEIEESQRDKSDVAHDDGGREAME